MPTRLEVESEAYLLVGRLMDLAGLAGRAADGTNRLLGAAIRDGLREMGYPVSDPIRVADADLAGLDGFALKRLLEWVELYVLTQMTRDWWRILQAPPQGVTPEGLALVESRVRGRLEELKAIVKRPFTPFVMPLAVGSAGAARAGCGVHTAWERTRPAWWYYGVEPGEFWDWGCS